MMKVVVYSTPTCPYCTMAKEHLKNLGVRFTDINVAADPVAAGRLFEMTKQMGVPVIVINEKAIVGFDKNAIDRALKASGKK
jgi:glutaredoxin-like YruB-family protein